MGSKSVQFYFDDKTAEILKLKKAKYKNKAIAKKVGRSESSVSRTISSLTAEKWQLLNKYVADIKNTKYFMRDLASPEMRHLAFKSLEQKTREGYWYGSPPFGYVIEDGKLKPHPEEAKLVREVLEGYRDGKSMTQLSHKTETDLPDYKILQILRHLEIYLGNTVRRGKIYHDTHPALIDEELAKDVKIALEYSRQHPWLRGPTLYGFMRGKYGRWIKDPSSSKEIVQMFELYQQYKNINKVARALKRDAETVRQRLKNPLYTNKVRAEEKPPHEWPDAGVELIISFETWIEVQQILSQRTKEVVAAEAQTERKMKTMYNVYEALLQLKRASTGQLMKKTGVRSHQTVQTYLKKLKEEEGKLIDRESGKRGKWYVKTPETSDKA